MPDPAILARMANEFFGAFSGGTAAIAASGPLGTTAVPEISSLSLPTSGGRVPTEAELRGLPATISAESVAAQPAPIRNCRPLACPAAHRPATFRRFRHSPFSTTSEASTPLRRPSPFMPFQFPRRQRPTSVAPVPSPRSPAPVPRASENRRPTRSVRRFPQRRPTPPASTPPLPQFLDQLRPLERVGVVPSLAPITSR